MSWNAHVEDDAEYDKARGITDLLVGGSRGGGGDHKVGERTR